MNTHQGQAWTVIQKAAVIAEIVGAAASVIGLYVLFVGNLDRLSVFLLCSGAFVFVGGCLYVLFARADVLVDAKGKAIRLYLFPSFWRRIAKLSLVLIGLIIVSGVAAWYLFIVSPINEVVVLVTDFEGKGVSHDVELSRRIFDKMSNDLVVNQEEDISVIWVDEVITSYDEASGLAKKYRAKQATVVIWGWADDLGVKSYFHVMPAKSKEEWEVALDEFALESAQITDFAFYLRQALPQQTTFIVTFMTGLAFSYQRDYQQALNSLLIAERNLPEELDSSFAFFYAELGDAYAFQSKPELADAAISAYQKAIGLDPELSSAYNNLGKLYGELGRTDEAIAVFLQAQEIVDDAMIALNLGNTYVEAGQREAAKEAYLRAISLDDSYADPRNNLGILHMQDGLLDLAIEQLEKAVELRPDLSSPHFNLGNAYYQQGRLQDAVREHKAALKADPLNFDAHNSLSVIYADQGELRSAIKEAKKSLAIAPDYFKAHYNLGRAYHLRSDLDRAIHEYQIALEINPDFSKAHFRLGLAHREEGELSLALEEFLAAKDLDLKYECCPTGEIDYEIVRTVFAMGKVYQENRLYDEAIEAYRIAVEINPLFVEAYHQMAIIHMSQWDHELAEEVLLKAIEIQPMEPVYHMKLGLVYHLTDRKLEAESEYLKAIEIAPTFIDAHSFLAALYRVTGRTELALEEYKKVLECPNNEHFAEDARKWIEELGNSQ